MKTILKILAIALPFLRDLLLELYVNDQKKAIIANATNAKPQKLRSTKKKKITIHRAHIPEKYWPPIRKETKCVVSHNTLDPAKYDKSILRVFLDYFGSKDAKGVSCQMYIDRTGKIFELVPMNRACNQSGNWELNQVSIGIEKEPIPGDPDRKFTSETLDAEKWLLCKIAERYNWEPADFLYANQGELLKGRVGSTLKFHFQIVDTKRGPDNGCPRWFEKNPGFGLNYCKQLAERFTKVQSGKIDLSWEFVEYKG